MLHLVSMTTRRVNDYGRQRHPRGIVVCYTRDVLSGLIVDIRQPSLQLPVFLLVASSLPPSLVPLIPYVLLSSSS